MQFLIGSRRVGCKLTLLPTWPIHRVVENSQIVVVRSALQNDISYLTMQLKTPPISPPHFAFMNVNEALQEVKCHHNPTSEIPNFESGSHLYPHVDLVRIVQVQSGAQREVPFQHERKLL